MSHFQKPLHVADYRGDIAGWNAHHEEAGRDVNGLVPSRIHIWTGFDLEPIPIREPVRSERETNNQKALNAQINSKPKAKHLQSSLQALKKILKIPVL